MTGKEEMVRWLADNEAHISVRASRVFAAAISSFKDGEVILHTSSTDLAEKSGYSLHTTAMALREMRENKDWVVQYGRGSTRVNIFPRF